MEMSFDFTCDSSYVATHSDSYSVAFSVLFLDLSLMQYGYVLMIWKSKNVNAIVV